MPQEVLDRREQLSPLLEMSCDVFGNQSGQDGLEQAMASLDDAVDMRSVGRCQPVPDLEEREKLLEKHVPRSLWSTSGNDPHSNIQSSKALATTSADLLMNPFMKGKRV